MIIVVHTSDDAPAHLRAIAHFLVGKHLLPVRVTASDAETARIKAQEFWDSEKARWLKRLNPDKPLKSIEAEHTPTEPVPPPVAPPTERQAWLGLVADTADAADGLPERETPPIDEAVVAEIKREAVPRDDVKKALDIAAGRDVEQPKKREAALRYFHHPESDSFFTSPDEQTDQFIVEYQKAEWEVARAKQEQPKPKKRVSDLDDLL